MSKEYKTTEFSAHISRSRMRRYLHGQLTKHENAEAETHLKHCVHCSEAIIQYIETEEPENYKTFIKALKGKIIESVKPKRPKFSTAQIKVMRAAAAVVLLFTFSFFAFENLIDKDFNLVAKSEKKGDTFVRNSVFPEEKPKTKTVQKQPQQIVDEEATPYEEEELEEEPEVSIAEAKPKAQKPTAAKNTTNAEVKKEVPQEGLEKSVVNNLVPKVADNVSSKEDNKEESPEVEDVPVIERTNSVAQVEKTESQTEDKVPQPVAPIQKIEKVNLEEDGNNLTEEKPAQVVPSATIGQLQQRK